MLVPFLVESTPARVPAINNLRATFAPVRRRLAASTGSPQSPQCPAFGLGTYLRRYIRRRGALSTFATHVWWALLVKKPGWIIRVTCTYMALAALDAPPSSVCAGDRILRPSARPKPDIRHRPINRSNNRSLSRAPRGCSLGEQSRPPEALLGSRSALRDCGANRSPGAGGRTKTKYVPPLGSRPSKQTRWILLRVVTTTSTVRGDAVMRTGGETDIRTAIYHGHTMETNRLDWIPGAKGPTAPRDASDAGTSNRDTQQRR